MNLVSKWPNGQFFGFQKIVGKRVVGDPPMGDVGR